MIRKTTICISVLFLAALWLLSSCAGKKESWYTDMIEETGTCTELESAIDLSIGGFKKGNCPSDFALSCLVEQKIAGQSLKGSIYYYKRGAFESVDISVMEEACKNAGGKIQKKSLESAGEEEKKDKSEQ